MRVVQGSAPDPEEPVAHTLRGEVSGLTVVLVHPRTLTHGPGQEVCEDPQSRGEFVMVWLCRHAATLTGPARPSGRPAR
ncbi:hypothetical protein GCM10027590_40230 [Nocardiopsis nanhaiensis]